MTAFEIISIILTILFAFGTVIVSIIRLIMEFLTFMDDRYRKDKN